LYLWKVGPKGLLKVSETELRKENILEENLEDWIIRDASLLGEPLLVIGHQVAIPDINDRLDILALDINGNSVIIELKRSILKDPVDIQALRYASYISKWTYENFEKQFYSYMKEVGADDDVIFNEKYEEFCNDSGVEEAPDINQDQRIIIVGSETKDKLGSVALWLRDHKVDITIIEVSSYRDGESFYIQPRTIIPLPVSRFQDVGKVYGETPEKPWRSNGEEWHLNKRCSIKTREMLIKLNNLITNNIKVDGPIWDQKYYVAHRVDNYNWIAIHTRATMLILNVHIKAGSIDPQSVATKLDIEKFDAEGTLSEKISGPSSIAIRHMNQTRDRLLLRIKEDFNFDTPQFITFLKEAYEARVH